MCERTDNQVLRFDVLPNFLVIGAQKAGTSWIHALLARLPDVFVPTKRKELMFFDIRENYERLGLDGYRKYFSSAAGKAIVGEATPGYLRCSTEYPEWGAADEYRRDIPVRVKQCLGADVKLVASLRNPVDRAVSAYFHHMRKGRIPPGSVFRAWWRRFGIVHHGFYAAHLRRWLEVFPQNQFFVITYEELFSSEKKCNALLTFLGSSGRFDRELWNISVNASNRYEWTESGIVGRDDRRLLVSVSELDELRSVYAKDVLELSRTWGLDVGAWVHSRKS